MRYCVSLFFGVFVVFVFLDGFVWGKNVLVELSKPKSKIVVKFVNFDKVDIGEVEVEVFNVRDGNKVSIEKRRWKVGGVDVVFFVSLGRYEVVISGGENVFRREVVVSKEGEVKVVNVSGYSLVKGGLVLYCGFESEEEIRGLGGVINRLGKNPNEEIKFVSGKEGNGMYVKGEHEESTTYDQVFIPLQGELTTEQGTIEFWFKPVGWDSNDECAAHYLFAFVADTNALEKFKNYKEGFLDARFWYGGWSGRHCLFFTLAKVTPVIFNTDPPQWDHDRNWSEFIWFSTPREGSSDQFKFRDGEWIHFKLVWDKNGGLFGGASVAIVINGKVYAKNFNKMPEIVNFPKFLAVGMSGGFWYDSDQSERNMYMNACGVFDELYVWNYPKLD